MNSLNVSAILALANKQNIDKELADLGVTDLSSEIEVALKEALLDERKEAAKAAVREIIQVIKLARAKEEKLVNAIRQARRMEAAAKAELKALSRAKAYAEATSNYIPLLTNVAGCEGMQFADISPALRSIPESFGDDAKKVKSTVKKPL